MIDLLGQGKLSLSRIEYLVLDEADEMLDAGFAPSVERILGLTYEPQTVLASATMPSWVTRLAEKQTHEAGQVRLKSDNVDRLEHGLLRLPNQPTQQSLTP